MVRRFAVDEDSAGSTPADHPCLVYWCSGQHASLSRKRSGVQIPYRSPIIKMPPYSNGRENRLKSDLVKVRILLAAPVWKGNPIGDGTCFENRRA